MSVDNPFSPPAATVADIAEVIDAGSLRGTGRRVPAAHAWHWLRGAVTLITAAPGTWVGMGLLFLLLTVGVSLLPIVGLFAGLLQIVVTGGVVLACHELVQQRPFTVAQMFDGFRSPHLGSLSILALLYFAATIVVIITAVLVATLPFAAAAVAGLAPDDVLTAQPLLAGVLLIGFVVMVVGASAILACAIWFSPALVCLHGVSPLDAMKRSLQASLSNIAAFTVLGLMAMAAVAMTVVPVVIAARLAPDLVLVAMIPLILEAVVMVFVGLPLFWATTYLSYRDVFIQ